jgi:transposase
MIVIGADTHKNTHALAAVDANTGQLRGEREIPARDVGHLEALRWAHELDGEIVWAIEDCRDLSYHLEQALLAAGERVVRVAPKLMGASRRGEREPGKSDQIDARAIGRAVLREGIERLPVAFLDEDAMEIRLLCDHRERSSTSAHGSSTGCGSTSSFSTPNWRHRSRRASSTTPGNCSASHAA